MDNKNFVIYNRELLDGTEKVIEVQNRAFRYGDGLFESIRLIDGKPCFLSNHINRLFDGMKMLKITAPHYFTIAFFEDQIKLLVAKNGIQGGGRVRLSIFRNSGGTYTPISNEGCFLLEASSYSENAFELNKEGLTIDVFPDMKKPVNKLSCFKTANSLYYILAGLYSKEKKLDDCLLLNETNNIIEASSSNIFIVSNGVLYTPALDDGCVGGTMRMTIINLALANNIKVYECPLNSQNLLSADEIFLTNAIRGITWVGSYKMKRYYNKIAKELLGILNKSLKLDGNNKAEVPPVNLKMDLQGSSPK